MLSDIPEETFGIIHDGDGENFVDLNAQLNLWDENGKIQLHKDREAARQYFLQHVNPNTVYFTDLEEKVEYLLSHGYYDNAVLEKYDFDFVISLLKDTYKRKYRFPTLISALKFYNQYALKTKDGKRYLERYEDRVVMNGLYLGNGDTELATQITEEIINNRFQPATPTFLNAGLSDRGYHISCFPAGTKVSVKGGRRVPIEEIQVNDYVITHTGESKRVYKTIENNNNEKMVTIKPSGSVAITMTENHPVLVWSEDTEGAETLTEEGAFDEKFRWVEAKDIRVGKDFVLFPSQKDSTNSKTTPINMMDFVRDIPVMGRFQRSENEVHPYEVDKSDGMIKYVLTKKGQSLRKSRYAERVKPVNQYVDIDEDFGRFIGYYLSEGHVGLRSKDKKPNAVVFTFGSHESDFIEDLVYLSEKKFGITPTVNHNKDDGSCKISINSVLVATMIYEHFGTGYNKKILDEFFYSSNDEFIRGLIIGSFRGDGCTFEDYMVMDLVNPELVRQMFDLCIRIGLTPGLRDYVNQAGNKTTSLSLRSVHSNNYEMIMDIAKNLSRFYEPGRPRIINNFQHPDGYGMLSAVLGKEFSDPVDKVYNLEVEDDHSYLAEGVAVHNCFLLEMTDSMESISRTITNSLQLSKNGGGVGICITNLRAEGDPIKGIEGAASGVVPVMKLFEDSFSYANQLGVRQGAGAVYISCHHPDIMKALDTKRENADEKIRIKTLSIGVVVSDKAFELAKNNEEMYLFSPHDVEKEYGKPMTEISISEKYDEMVDNPRIAKSKINARKFFQTVAELQFESGYPYILFEDTANRFHYISGNRISYSNLCVSADTEILTPQGYKKMGALWKEHGELDIDTHDAFPVDFSILVDGRTIGKGHKLEEVTATRVVRTAELAPVYKLTTEAGRVLRATEWHKMFTLFDGREIVKVSLGELHPGNILLVSNEDGTVGTDIIADIEFDGEEDVYDVQVPRYASVIFNGIATGNCSEIMQTSESSTFTESSEYNHIGRDISCNLASINIAKAMNSGNFKDTVNRGIRALTTVSVLSNVSVAPSVKRGNELSHSVGLGAMNLHGFLGSEKIHYGSREALDFVNVYFATARYHALSTSADIARETGQTFYDFDKSGYKIQPGQQRSEALKYYTTGVWETFPHTDRIKQMFEEKGQWFPTQEDWVKLEEKIQKCGLYHMYLSAVAPTGSISYVNFSTSSIHPVVSPIEVRKESKLGRIYSPAYGLDNDNLEYYQDAYTIGYKKVIDTYSVAQKHIDQGISSTLFFNNTAEDKATTREVNKAYIYAYSRDKVKNEFGEVALYDPRTSWYSGMQKSLYYLRTKTQAVSGTEVECVSCSI